MNNKVAIHICSGKYTLKSHKPELIEEYKTLKETIRRAKELVKKYPTTAAVVNWYDGHGWAYQILETGEVRKYSTRK